MLHLITISSFWRKRGIKLRIFWTVLFSSANVTCCVLAWKSPFFAFIHEFQNYREYSRLTLLLFCLREYFRARQSSRLTAHAYTSYTGNSRYRRTFACFMWQNGRNLLFSPNTDEKCLLIRHCPSWTFFDGVGHYLDWLNRKKAKKKITVEDSNSACVVCW